MATAAPDFSAQTALTSLACGPMPIAPKAIADYLDHSPYALETRGLVEQYHFGPAVRRLRGNARNVMSDLHYVLQHLPNHHVALNLVSKLEHRDGKLPKPRGGLRGENYGFQRAICYIQRGIKWNPKDPTPPMVLGIHLHRLKEYDRAKEAYESAIRLSPRYAEAHYNLGLLAFDKGDFEGAIQAARKAAELGYPLSGLRKKLARAGHDI